MKVRRVTGWELSRQLSSPCRGCSMIGLKLMLEEMELRFGLRVFDGRGSRLELHPYSRREGQKREDVGSELLHYDPVLNYPDSYMQIVVPTTCRILQPHHVRAADV